MYETPIAGQYGDGGITAVAGTVINVLVPPRKGCFTVLTSLAYLSAGTQHTVTAFRPLATTILTADAAAGQAVVALQREPGNYAANALADGGPVPSTADNTVTANDWFVFEKPDGTFHLAQANAVLSALALTLTANLPTGGLKAGTRAWFLGAAADVNPRSGRAHTSFAPPVSARTVYQESLAGVLGSFAVYEPILLQSSNGTAAGTFDFLSAYYTTKGGFRTF
jgi:hypothetical protein